MIDYWQDLVNYKQEEKKYRYFRAEVDSDGEAKRDTIVEINFVEERNRIREQIQEDVSCYLDGDEDRTTDVCQIVVDNFKDFE